MSICLWLAASPHAARAQPTYGRWIDLALEAFNVRDFSRAHEAFQRANLAEPSARALRGMGVASYRMGRYAQAAVELEAALNETHRPLGALRASVQRLLDHIAGLLGYIELEVAPAQATVTIDAEPALRNGKGWLLVTSGEHECVIRADGFMDQRFLVTVDVGQTRQLRAELSAIATRSSHETAPPVEDPDPVVASAAVAARIVHSAAGIALAPTGAAHDDSPPVRETGASRVWPWLALSAVPVFALGAGLSWNHTVDLGDAIATHCDHMACTAQQRQTLVARSGLSTYETLTDVGLALGATSLLTGVCLWLVGGPRSDHAVLNMSGGRASLHVEF
jgi:hypothetical protein